ncbi:hypothetical protein JCM10212_006914 [Sporobolomyces blumeae]
MIASTSAPTSTLTVASPRPACDMISLGLTRINRLLHALHSPHVATPIVHIAGTNGKGSVSAYLASILHAANLRVGRFNSPHLVDEWDCLRVGETVVDEKEFTAAKGKVESTNAREGLDATPFEVLTATAFSLFAQAKLDLAVVEVGMGGEGDATNVVPADQTLLSILTAVDLDHQGFLGNTVEEIAKVKSGIVRDRGDLVVALQAFPEVAEVARSVAACRNARIWQASSASVVEPSNRDSTSTLASIPLRPASSAPPSDLVFPSGRLEAHLPLSGSYQLANSSTAVLAAHLLRTLPRTLSVLPKLAQISNEAIRTGVERTRWDGRLQWLDLPPDPSARIGSSASDSIEKRTRRILLDGAHNPSSASLLATYLSSLPTRSRPTTLVFGLSAPRAARDVLAPLLDRESSTGIKRIVCVGFSPPVGMPWVRATLPRDLALAVRAMEVEGVEVVEAAEVEEALGKTDDQEKVVVAGSLYLVADALRLSRQRGVSLQ